MDQLILSYLVRNLTFSVPVTSCSLHLRSNDPMCQDMLEAAQLEGSLAEKALGMLVGTKLNMSQQRVLAAKKAYWCSWLH